MTASAIAQIIMVATLLLMITGKTPIYITAICGATISALVAGFPITGKEGMTIAKMVSSGLNPVIADMTGILLFIGIMQATGFMDVIIRDIDRVGNKLGGGTGVCTAGGIAAGVIGALTGFTQPVITAVITGPAAVRLGVDPNKCAGIQAHAGHIGNLAGFTHPTQVVLIATAGISFGLFNVLGLIACLAIFLVSAIRCNADMRRRGVQITAEDRAKIMAEIESREYATSSLNAFLPFVILLVGFVLGFPVFLVGLASAIVCMLLAKKPAREAEAAMMKGVSLIATPIVATIGFLFMSTVIKQIGLVQTMSDAVGPILSVSPVLILFGVAFLTGFLTQSYAASVSVLVPMLQVVLQTGADPFAACFAAASGASLIQYFLTGGPVAALATVIPVVPGSDLKTANAFQRPSILSGCLVAFIITVILTIV